MLSRLEGGGGGGQKSQQAKSSQSVTTSNGYQTVGVLQSKLGCSSLKLQLILNFDTTVYNLTFLAAIEAL